MTKKMPETDFGLKESRRTKFEFSRLNPNFKKRIGLSRLNSNFKNNI